MSAVRVTVFFLIILYLYIFFFFFFSSRRRHTRLQGDWSSDVCSSDLGTVDFQKMTSVGRLETGAFENITVRAAFLGVHGISASGGIGMLTPEEAVMNRAFVDAAQSVNVLVDSDRKSVV